MWSQNRPWSPHSHPGQWWGASVRSPDWPSSPLCPVCTCRRSLHCHSPGLAAKHLFCECQHLSEEHFGIQITNCITPFIKQVSSVDENWKADLNLFHKVLSLTSASSYFLLNANTLSTTVLAPKIFSCSCREYLWSSLLGPQSHFNWPRYQEQWISFHSSRATFKPAWGPSCLTWTNDRTNECLPSKFGIEINRSQGDCLHAARDVATNSQELWWSCLFLCSLEENEAAYREKGEWRRLTEGNRDKRWRENTVWVPGSILCPVSTFPEAWLHSWS